MEDSIFISLSVASTTHYHLLHHDMTAQANSGFLGHTETKRQMF